MEAPEGVLDDGIVGAQMWLALPDATRDGPTRFEHHAELPAVDVGSGQARVIAGELDGARSPARLDHPALGLDVSFRGTVDVPLAPRLCPGSACGPRRSRYRRENQPSSQCTPWTTRRTWPCQER